MAGSRLPSRFRLGPFKMKIRLGMNAPGRRVGTQVRALMQTRLGMTLRLSLSGQDVQLLATDGIQHLSNWLTPMIMASMRKSVAPKRRCVVKSATYLAVMDVLILAGMLMYSTIITYPCMVTGIIQRWANLL